jgi:prepilin-type N-terminal cleavage/methylation domain-containing protein
MSERGNGFSLIEVVIATALLVAALTGVAQLFASSTGANVSSRQHTVSTLAAIDKLEQLRALPFDDPMLAVSPPGTLINDVDGYFDAPLEGYRRRWSIAALPSFPATAVVLQVVVFKVGRSADAHLVTVKARKAA